MAKVALAKFERQPKYWQVPTLRLVGTLLSKCCPSHCRSKYDSRRYHILTDDLRAARRDKGWTQKTLADRVGTSAQAIMRLEKGIGSAETLHAAMDALEFRLTGVGPGRTLSEQLRSRRMRRSQSLDRLSPRTGVSRTTLASLERGGGMPPFRYGGFAFEVES